MAGWDARTRPLTGPLSPHGPQPAVLMLIRSTKSLHGPIATSKEVRLFSTDALPVGLQARQSLIGAIQMELGAVFVLGVTLWPPFLITP